MTTYLDFEEPLKALEEQIEHTKKIGETTDVYISRRCVFLVFKWRVLSK